MNIGETLEHTLLAAHAGESAIESLCEEALEFGFAGVCVNPTFVRRCALRLQGSAVKVVTVIGFPLGAGSSASDCAEVDACLKAGADEFDMVIPLGAALDGDLTTVTERVRQVANAAQGRPLKTILESAHFEGENLRQVALAALAGGANYLKTSTGFGPGGATLHAVTELCAIAHAHGAKVKASGGIKTLTTARAMLEAGAARLGTSSGIDIVRAQAGERKG